MGLGGLSCGNRTAETLSLLAFVPKLASISNNLNTQQLKAYRTLKSLILVQSISHITKAINKHFHCGMDVKFKNSETITIHPFVLTCITDGPGL